MTMSLDTFEALQAAVAIAERKRQQGDLAGAYEGYVAIATARLGRSRLTRADLTVCRSLADLAALFGEYDGATALLEGITGLYAAADNEQWADFTRCQQMHLALDRGDMERVEAMAQAMAPRIGNVRRIAITPDGLDRWEATCQWRNTTPRDRRLLFVHMYLALGRWLSALGQYGGGILLLQRGLAHLAAEEAAGEADAIAMQAAIPLYLILGQAQSERGDFAAAMAAWQQVDQRLQQQPDPSFEIHLRELQGQLYLRQGQLGQGLAAFQQVLSQLRELSFHRPGLRATLNLAAVLILLNQTQPAEAYLASVRQDIAQLNDGGLRQKLMQLEQLAQLRGRLDPGMGQSNQTARQKTTSELVNATSARSPSGPWRVIRSASYLTTFENGCLLVQLALGQFDFVTAQQHFAQLQQSFQASDSDIIQQRLALWQAILRYYAATVPRTGGTRDMSAVLPPIIEQFTQVAQQLRSLGLLPDLYLAERYRTWCQARWQETSVTAEHWQAVQALQQTMVASLSAQDQAVYLLNKWTAEEAAIASQTNDLARQRQALRQLPRWRRPWARWQLLRRLHGHLQQLEDYKQRQSYQARTGDESGSSQVTSQSLWRCLVTHPRRRLTVSFLVLPDRILVVRWSWLQLDFHVLPTTRLALRNTVQAWHQALVTAGRSRAISAVPETAPSHGKSRPTEALQAIAADLARQLHADRWLQPISPRIKALAIVPDGSLHGFPFAALPYQGGHLCERFSLSLTYDLVPIRRSRPSRQAAQALLMGVGQALTISAEDGTQQVFPTLPGVELEMAAIRDRLQQQRLPLVTPQPLTHNAATKAALLRHLSPATWLHLACHGTFTANRPDQSGLVLGNGTATDQIEQGTILSIRELSYLDLSHLQQVILSACWSADHYVLPGRWVISLPETLWQAGAESILGALWEVDDRFAIPFMTQFYTHLKTLPRDRALRQTQLDCLRGTLPGSGPLDTKNPFYWASFALYGNPGKLAFSR